MRGQESLLHGLKRNRERERKKERDIFTYIETERKREGGREGGRKRERRMRLSPYNRATLLCLTNDSQVDKLGLRCTSLNFPASKRPVAPSRWAQRVIDRAGKKEALVSLYLPLSIPPSLPFSLAHTWSGSMRMRSSHQLWAEASGSDASKGCCVTCACVCVCLCVRECV